MSFILDALKKSEAERQRQAGPALLEMRVVRPRRRIPLWVWIAGGALLLVNGVVIGFLAMRGPPATTPAPAAAPTAAAAPPSSAAPAPATIAPPAGNVAPWAGDTSGANQDRAATPYQRGTAETAVETTNPADFEPATTPPGGASVGVGRSSGDLRSYNEIGGNVPELRLDLHVYAANPRDRYAFINMRRVKEGDITAEGARVMEITRDGVVLTYRNTEFLLGRE